MMEFVIFLHYMQIFVFLCGKSQKNTDSTTTK